MTTCCWFCGAREHLVPVNLESSTRGAAEGMECEDRAACEERARARARSDDRPAPPLEVGRDVLRKG